jgi:hypothetical protein
MAQSCDSSSVSMYYLGWPLHLLRGNSASENLPCKAQQPKCCLYKTPDYIAAHIRETGDIIAGTSLYAWFPTYAPTRTRYFFLFTSNALLKRPVLFKYWLLRPCSTRKPLAKAVPSKDYFMYKPIRPAALWHMDRQTVSSIYYYCYVHTYAVRIMYNT